MKFSQYWSEKIKNNMSFRMTALFSGITILCLVTLMGVFIGTQQRATRQQIAKANANLAAQFCNYTDRLFLDRVYTIMQMDLFIREHDPKDDFTFLDPRNFTYDHHQFDRPWILIQRLQQLHESTGYIKSVGIYNMASDTFISSESGAVYHYLQGEGERRHRVLLEAARQGTRGPFWLPMETAQTGRRLIYVQTTPAFASADKRENILLLEVDTDTLFVPFFAKSDAQRERYRIVDGFGAVLYDTRGYPGTLEEELWNMVRETSAGSGATHTREGELGVAWQRSDYNDWTYLYTAQDGFYASFFSAIWAVTLCFLLVFLLGIAGSVLAGRFLYRPVSHLVESALARMQHVDIGSDISIIREAFDQDDSRMREMQTVIQHNSALLLEHIAQELVRGNIAHLEELNERINVQGIRFCAPCFYLLLIKADEEAYGAMCYRDKEIIHLSVEKIVRRYFNAEGTCTQKVLTLFDYSGLMTVAANGYPEDYDDAPATAIRLLGILERECGILFNIALSRSAENFYELHEAFRQAEEYFKYSFIHGCGNVFSEKSIREYDRSPVQFNAAMLKNMEEHLKAKRFSELKEELSLLFSQIQAQGYSYLYAYNLFFQITSLLTNECRRNNLNLADFSQQEIVLGFKNMSSMERCVEWLYKVLDQYEQGILERKNDIEKSFISDVMEYVCSHVEELISLGSVAAHFLISAGYLSRTFKRVTGEHFSDFSAAVKFDKACAWLSTTNNKVGDIAAELGYLNITYFNKLFKERFGMTPTQYRKQHGRENQSEPLH